MLRCLSDVTVSASSAVCAGVEGANEKQANTLVAIASVRAFPGLLKGGGVNREKAKMLRGVKLCGTEIVSRTDFVGVDY
jgi:hypothetical protein